jgi:hypothetical protein
MNKTVLDVLPGQGLSGNMIEQFSDALFIQGIKCRPQTVIVQIISCNPFADESFDRPVLEESRGQVQGAAGKPQTVENHCLHRLSDADFPLGFLNEAINAVDQTDFIAHPRNQP